MDNAEAAKLAGILSDFPNDSSVAALAEQYLFRYYNDANVDPETNGEYRFLNRILPYCRTVFDVGASGGEWAERALQINPSIGLHCFEPLPLNQLSLVSRIGGRAVVNACAVGAVDGRMSLNVLAEDRDSNWQLSSLYAREQGVFGEAHKMPVDVISLETYCQRNRIEHIDFLKIDVEGAEVDVLTGAARLLREGRIMAVQFEYGTTWLDARCQLRDVFDLVQGTGYAVGKLTPDGYRLFDRYWSGLDSFRYSNWLILHPDIARDA